MISQQRRETGFLLPDRFVGKKKAPLQKHLSEVAKAQLVAQSPENDLQDNLGREGQVIEGRAGALVECPTAGTAGTGPIAESECLRSARHGDVVQLNGLHTKRTMHRLIL